MLLKGLVGISTNSRALLADALYSLKDLTTSFVILMGLEISMKPLDKEHPYGHGKIEFVASAVISFVFVMITAVFFWLSISGLMGAHSAPIHWLAFSMACVSMFVGIFLDRYFSCVGKQTNSPIIMTLAKHTRADAFSSALVAAGIIGTRLGFYFMDSMVAVLETIHLIIVGLEIFNESFKGLMDSSIPKENIKNIREVSMKVEGVSGIGNIRSRQSGQMAYVDMEILLTPDMPVSMACGITKKVEYAVMEQVNNIGSVQVSFKGLQDFEEGAVPVDN